MIQNPFFQKSEFISPMAHTRLQQLLMNAQSAEQINPGGKLQGDPGVQIMSTLCAST